VQLEVPAAQMSVQKTSQGLLVRGDVSSTAHEVILRQTVIKHFISVNAQFDLRYKTHTPPGWALITELTLQAVAQTQSSTTTINAGLVGIRGFTSVDSDWSNAIDRVDAFLLPGMRLENEVAVLTAAGSYESMCRKQFEGALRGQKFAFAHDSAHLPGTMASLLDALLEIATDCPGAMITISGHTDSSGPESANISLSKLRADSVAAYLVDHGLDPVRLSVRGVGSAEPISDNSTPASRQRNRRIEFSMIFE